MKPVFTELVLGGCTFYIALKYKKNDIVLTRSCAGDSIPPIHVKLIKRVVVAPSKGTSMDWPGYSGWEATPVYQDEIDILKKEWSIPLTKKDLTFVYDDDILNKEKKK